MGEEIAINKKVPRTEAKQRIMAAASSPQRA
jgi:hypothetical protein